METNYSNYPHYLKLSEERLNKKEQRKKRFESYKDQIESFIKQKEEEYEIVIFYASETGSRGQGTDVDDSDFDITGFFTPRNEMDYFKILRKYDKCIKTTHEKIILEGIEYDLDLELWDIKDWLRSKVEKNLTSCDFWFESEFIYRNCFPELTKEIRSHINPPFLLYWGKSKSALTYNSKDISNKGECLNKKLMNVLTFLFQYFHYQIFYDWPKYDIFEQILFLYENKSFIISEGIQETDFEVFDEAVGVYLNLYEQKKKSRKSTSTNIPNEIYKFITVSENRFNTKKKKSDLFNLFKESLAQNIFDEIRRLVNKKIKE